ncbi:MAG: hypothetical protein JRJ76_17235, partial [Deltaproteobacteria bacterium]|nr:hypothetical protein [Deltaproteobacteria bacterium]
MLNVQVEGEYDAEKNIMTIYFINKPLTVEDVDYTVSPAEHSAQQPGAPKVRSINDIPKMGMASA